MSKNEVKLSRLRTPKATRTWRASPLAAALLFLLTPIAARAAINPNFTPVDLVRQSQLIARLKVQRSEDGTVLRVRETIALAGEAPESLTLTIDARDAQVTKTLDKAFAGAETAAALLFAGDFSAAVDEENTTRTNTPVGALQMGTVWFALLADGENRFIVTSDRYELITVWAGSTEMLVRAVKYIAPDYTADMPVRAGIAWGTDSLVAASVGTVHDCFPCGVDGTGKPRLFVAAEQGDLLFEYRDGEFEDVSAQFGLTTRSRAAVWADVNGDRRLDLASWDGKRLTVYLAADDGRLAAGGTAINVSGPCCGLSAFDVGPATAAALVVSTAGGPQIVARDRDGRFQVTGLSPPPSSTAAGGPALVGDFDDDAVPDIAQPSADGLWLFKGSGGASFQPATIACSAAFGTGLAQPIAGDYDADGHLDLVMMGADGCFVLLNQGNGTFREVLDESGEVSYITKPRMVGGANLDVNNDGRQDLMFFYRAIQPQLYFNRGFCCFGFAFDVDFVHVDLDAARASRGGQQAHAVADFNGDGAQDIAFATGAGEVWVMFRDKDERKLPLSLTVRPPGGQVGPVTVVAHDGRRCLGAQRASHRSPAFFAKRNKGPLSFAWKGRAGAQQTRKVILLKPKTLVLPMERPAP